MSLRHLLFIDADLAFLQTARQHFENLGHQVTTQKDRAVVADLLEAEHFDLVVCGTPEDNGTEFELLGEIKAQVPELPVILMTRGGSIEGAVLAMRNGASDYLAKPFSMEMLEELVNRYLEDVHVSNHVVAVAENSVALLKLARRVAARDVSVLISGESGTGKEVLARYIHEHSHRSDEPFIAINCAAIPENMLEAMLFGYEKGAFTGAVQTTQGKFEQAHGGTLLLDEISEMDIGLQAKLLRVLQEREVERLGGRATIPLDVRVLATTNRKLQQEVREGRFREDLFYRLNVFPLQLQPLRKRPDDIIPLTKRLISDHHTGPYLPRLTSEAMKQLREYVWPGNVRELSNVVQRALVLCNGSEIHPEDLHFEAEFLEDIAPTVNDRKNLTSNLKSHEYDLILKALNDGNGSRKRAADKLGISARTLRYKLAKMREMGMDIPVAG
ncbi:MAG: sigma-54-dependent transcriptional regulator [bacterium]